MKEFKSYFEETNKKTHYLSYGPLKDANTQDRARAYRSSCTDLQQFSQGPERREEDLESRK